MQTLCRICRRRPVRQQTGTMSSYRDSCIAALRAALHNVEFQTQIEYDTKRAMELLHKYPPSHNLFRLCQLGSLIIRRVDWQRDSSIFNNTSIELYVRGYERECDEIRKYIGEENFWRPMHTSSRLRSYADTIFLPVTIKNVPTRVLCDGHPV